MTERRTRGEGGLRWHETRQRWIAEVTIGHDARGKRIVRSASGRTRTEAKSKLRELLRDQADGVTAINTSTTVRQAVDDWLTYGLPRRSQATVEKYRSWRYAHLPPDRCSEAARPLRRRRGAVADPARTGPEHSHAAGTAQHPEPRGQPGHGPRPRAAQRG